MEDSSPNPFLPARNELRGNKKRRGRKGVRISRVQFILVSAVIVVTALALSYVAEVSAREMDLRRELKRRATIEEVNEDLIKEIEQIISHVFEVEEEKKELEEMLLNRARTYRAVTSPTASRSLPSREVQQGEGIHMPLLGKSGFTAKLFDRAFARLNKPDMVGLGEAFVAAEAEWGVNSLALAAIACLESGWGTSQIARDKNNLLGLGAYDCDPYHYAISFPTPEDSITYAAKLLAVEYLDEGGRWYRGDDLVSVNICYATSKQWAGEVVLIMRIIARAAIDNPEELVSAAEEVMQI